MNMLFKFSGILGLVLLLFGVLGALIVGSFIEQPLILFHLVLGAVLLGIWFFKSGIESIGDAGNALRGRTARYGYNVSLYTVVFIGILAVINIFSSIYNQRLDLTEEGVYSLSPKSASIVQSLTKPLKLVAIDTGKPDEKEKTKSLLDLYQYGNRKQVSVEFIDPRSKPVEVDTKLGMKQGNLLYVQYGEGESKVISRLNTVSEQEITNAIIKLMRGESKKIYFIQGHGEPELAYEKEGGMKQFSDALADESLKVEGLPLLQVGKIPEDASAVILASPKRALQPGEKDVLIKYAEEGGRLMLFGDAENQSSTDVADIAQHFGITVGRDVVIDELLRLLEGPQLGVQFYAVGYTTHPISAKLSDQNPPLLAFSSSVTVSGKADAQTTYTDVIKAGPKSWGERNLALIFNSDNPAATLDPDDLKGPVTVAVAYNKKIAASPAAAGNQANQDQVKFDKESRVIVFGDTTWLQNGYINLATNRDLALNTVNWSIGEEGGVAIGPKSIRTSMAPISQGTYNIILATSFILPELILLFGLFIWWRRKHAFA